MMVIGVTEICTSDPAVAWMETLNEPGYVARRTPSELGLIGYRL